MVGLSALGNHFSAYTTGGSGLHGCGYEAHQRSHDSARLYDLPRALLRIATNCIQHDVHVTNYIFKFGSVTVDCFIDTEIAQVLVINGGGSSDYPRTVRLGYLHCEATN